MAKKHKHPEHVNLERYLISYADFITLLFATFVVLYALSQVDIKDFQALESSIKAAFDAPSVMQGSEGVMQGASSSLFDSSQADSMITPLMMEYVSQKYEEQAFQDIEKSIDAMGRTGELEGVETTRSDKGLVITFSDDYLFKSGSAELIPQARAKLDKVGVLILKKFVLHNMRVEGYTDNQPISSKIYPSNWELSSARSSSIIRYFIDRFNFMPSLFTAVGFAETRPVASNDTPANRAKNRRVELIILRNKFKSQESSENEVTKMSKEQQEKLQKDRLDSINRIGDLSKTAQNFSSEEELNKQDAIILNRVYDKEIQRISRQTSALDSETRSKITGQGSWLKPPAKIVEKPVKIDDIKVFNNR